MERHQDKIPVYILMSLAFKYPCILDWAFATLSKRAAEMAVNKATVTRMANSNPQLHRHTSSLTFRHPPPHSARISYANEGPLFVSEQLSTNTVSAFRKVWALRLWNHYNLKPM